MDPLANIEHDLLPDLVADGNQILLFRFQLQVAHHLCRELLRLVVWVADVPVKLVSIVLESQLDGHQMLAITHASSSKVPVLDHGLDGHLIDAIS